MVVTVEGQQLCSCWAAMVPGLKPVAKVALTVDRELQRWDEAFTDVFHTNTVTLGKMFFMNTSACMQYKIHGGLMGMSAIHVLPWHNKNQP